MDPDTYLFVLLVALVQIIVTQLYGVSQVLHPVLFHVDICNRGIGHTQTHALTRRLTKRTGVPLRWLHATRCAQTRPANASKRMLGLRLRDACVLSQGASVCRAYSGDPCVLSDGALCQLMHAMLTGRSPQTHCTAC